jgi:hypothetical protein
MMIAARAKSCLVLVLMVWGCLAFDLINQTLGVIDCRGFSVKIFSVYFFRFFCLVVWGWFLGGLGLICPV